MRKINEHNKFTTEKKLNDKYSKPILNIKEKTFEDEVLNLALEKIAIQVNADNEYSLEETKSKISESLKKHH